MNLQKIHYRKDKKDLVKQYYLALIPLLIFGIYKNGILLYQTNLINIKDIFWPLYFYLISIIIAFVVSKIAHDNSSELILTSLICAASISLNTNRILYPILLFVLLFICVFLKKKIKGAFNDISLIRIFLILGLLANSYSYLNIGEKLNKFNYDLFDIFIGHGLGGLANTSLLILIISLIILSLNKFYKKVIPIAAYLTFIGISLCYILITKNYSYLETMLNGYVFFSFIFIASNISTSPYHKKGMLIYGILIGLLTSILTIFLKFEGCYISIFLVSLLIPFINNYTNKKYLHK